MSPKGTKNFNDAVVNRLLEIVAQNAATVTQIELIGAGITKLPDCIERFTALQTLNLKNCKSLKTLPDSLVKLATLGSLKEINLKGCYPTGCKAGDELTLPKGLGEVALENAPIQVMRQFVAQHGLGVNLLDENGKSKDGRKKGVKAAIYADIVAACAQFSVRNHPWQSRSNFRKFWVCAGKST